MFLQSAMLAAGAMLVLDSALTAGGMIAASVLMGRALAPVEQVLNGWPVLLRARTSWRYLSMQFECVGEQTEMGSSVQAKGDLSVSELTVIPPGRSAPVLRNLSFKLEPGQALGVIGPSGSGKSALAKALIGLWPPAIGDIRLGGVSLDRYAYAERGQIIGHLGQDVTLFRGTIGENVAGMAVRPDANKLAAAIEASKADTFLSDLDAGSDTYLNDPKSELSGGQRQRIGLARALYGNPSLLVLDDPSSALDADGSAALNEAIRDAKSSGQAVVIMSHRPAAIQNCDRLAVLEAGRITKIGPRDEILKSMLKNGSAIRHARGAA
jgi:ATP-binding cassette subfamily C protein